MVVRSPGNGNRSEFQHRCSFADACSFCNQYIDMNELCAGSTQLALTFETLINSKSMQSSSSLVVFFTLDRARMRKRCSTKLSNVAQQAGGGRGAHCRVTPLI